MNRQVPLDPALAQALAEQRKRLGLTQNCVALATGIPVVTLARYELAYSPIPPARRAVIEQVLDAVAAGGKASAVA